MAGRDRLDRQIDFLLEIDRLKHVLRASPVADGSRKENSGEHSWHLAMFALVLADEAGPDVSIDRVIRMLLIHDIVEIDAGDTPIHGANIDRAAQERAEARAADRLFGLLPADQGAGLRSLWAEFEAGESPDARFAKALDRCQPPLLNLASGGGSWADYNVTLDHIDTRVGTPARRGAPALWDRVRARIKPWFDART
jgi:putative hydrolase of HD superfamily